MSDVVGTPRDADLTAAEFVLGTLDASERAAFEQQMRDDAAARRQVGAWEHRFAGLAAGLTPVTPSAAVWDNIERALGRRIAETRPALAVIEGTPRAGADLAASRGRWRFAALTLGAIAAALAVYVVAGISPPKVVPGDRYIAAVTRGGDQPALIVRVDLATRRVLVMPVAAQAPTGRSLELWYIGDDQPPRSMGLVDKANATIGMPAGAAGAGATFAISVEPPGGSKTGAPTGPVVYSGKLIRE